MEGFRATKLYSLLQQLPGALRAWSHAVAGLIVFTIAMVPGGTSVLHAADLTGSFKGSAFATFANVTAGPVAAQLGRSAFQPCPCRGTNGQVLSNTVNAIRAGDSGKVLSANSTVSTVLTSKTATTASVANTSTINGINLLNGLITATSVKAVARVAATTSSISPDGSTSFFSNLKIAGTTIPADVAANTQITLPGFGKVTLKKIQRSGNLTSLGKVTVQMLTVDISQANSLGLPVGSQIVVGFATATFTRSQPTVVVAGQAYATFANSSAGSNLQNRIGKAALVTMGCEGTGGQTLSNSVNSFAVGTLLTLGNSVSTAFGGPQGGGTVAITTSTIENASFLGGLITAASITAVAQENFIRGVRTRSTSGSGFSGLSIGSVSIPVIVPPNTQISLPGLGKVVVNEQIVPAIGGKTQVNGLHIFITVPNLLGLPVGSEIFIGHAEASAVRY